ncbi:unnamed protein product, partial [Mesorhabditis spiculigera]
MTNHYETKEPYAEIHQPPQPPGDQASFMYPGQVQLGALSLEEPSISPEAEQQDMGGQDVKLFAAAGNDLSHDVQPPEIVDDAVRTWGMGY